MKTYVSKITMILVTFLTSLFGTPDVYAELGNLEVVGLYSDCSNVTSDDYGINVFDDDYSINYRYEISEDSSDEEQQEIIDDSITMLLSSFEGTSETVNITDGVTNDISYVDVSYAFAGQNYETCYAYCCINGNSYVRLGITMNNKGVEMEKVVENLLSQKYLNYKH